MGWPLRAPAPDGLQTALLPAEIGVQEYLLEPRQVFEQATLILWPEGRFPEGDR